MEHSSSPSTRTFTVTGTSPPSARNAAAWIATPDLSSAEPRPYSRPSRTSGSNGGESHCSIGPSGWTSWCAYSSTVGAPAGPSICPKTAG